MTHFDSFDQRLESWLEASADVPVPASLHERVLEPATRRRPRPAMLAWVGSHRVSDVPNRAWAAMPWARPVFLAIVVLLVLALGAAILVGGRLRQVPPADFPLVFSQDGDIVMSGWDGANPVVIADGAPSGDRSGTWYALAGMAPDGRHFVYHEVRPGQVPLVTTYISDVSLQRLASFVIDEPTPGQTPLPTPAPGAKMGDRYLKSTSETWWSPDSTLIATFPWSANEVRIFGLDGRLRYELQLPDGYRMWRELGFAWAPDGRSVLVVITSQGDEVSDALSAREVWQLQIDGSASRQLPSDHPFATWDLRATHDGRRIAFSGHNSPFDDGPIYLANGDGSDPRPVTHPDPLIGSGSFPRWSPDDTQIAYLVGLGDGDLHVELRVVDLRTGVDRPVVRLREDGSVNYGWSADGGRLLFRAYWVDPAIDIHAGDTDLWSVRPDGTDLRLLAEGVDAFLAWP